jgi:hypothetical protein
MNCCDRDARQRRRGDRTVEELWREEQGSLRPLPQKLPAACVSRSGKVNRRQQVRFAGNWYSVPPRYVGQVVTIRAYVFSVEIAWQDQVIASHSRSYRREEEVLNPHHYLPVLLKKPGAFPRATPILKWPLPPVYEAYHRQLRERGEGQGGTRDYIRILMLLQDHPLPAVTAAVEQAATIGVFSYEAVKSLLSGQLEPSWRHSPLPVWPNRVDHFDRLVHG